MGTVKGQRATSQVWFKLTVLLIQALKYSQKSLTSALDGSRWPMPHPPALPSGKRPSNHSIRGWVSHRTRFKYSSQALSTRNKFTRTTIHCIFLCTLGSFLMWYDDVELTPLIWFCCKMPQYCLHFLRIIPTICPVGIFSTWLSLLFKTASSSSFTTSPANQYKRKHILF